MKTLIKGEAGISSIGKVVYFSTLDRMSEYSIYPKLYGNSVFKVDAKA